MLCVHKAVVRTHLVAKWQTEAQLWEIKELQLLSCKCISPQEVFSNCSDIHMIHDWRVQYLFIAVVKPHTLLHPKHFLSNWQRPMTPKHPAIKLYWFCYLLLIRLHIQCMMSCPIVINCTRTYNCDTAVTSTFFLCKSYCISTRT